MATMLLDNDSIEITTPATTLDPADVLAEPTVARILAAGKVAYVAVTTATGPFVTPVLYGVSGGRLWFLIRHQTFKARALDTHPEAGLLVRGVGDSSVVMQGQTRMLSPRHMPALVRRFPDVAHAPCALLSWATRNPSAAMGFARDASRIASQLAPQNFVLVAFVPNRVATIDGDRIEYPAGAWPFQVLGRPAPTAHTPWITRACGATWPDELANARLEPLLGHPGPAVLGVTTPTGPMALPARWDPPTATVPAGLVLDFEHTGRGFDASLTVDRPVRQRPTEQRGLMLRGRAHIAHTAARPGGVSFHIHPQRVTYWNGFETGTVPVYFSAPSQSGAAAP